MARADTLVCPYAWMGGGVPVRAWDSARRSRCVAWGVSARWPEGSDAGGSIEGEQTRSTPLRFAQGRLGSPLRNRWGSGIGACRIGGRSPGGTRWHDNKGWGRGCRARGVGCAGGTFRLTVGAENVQLRSPFIPFITLYCPLFAFARFRSGVMSHYRGRSGRRGWWRAIARPVCERGAG